MTREYQKPELVDLKNSKAVGDNTCTGGSTPSVFCVNGGVASPCGFGSSASPCAQGSAATVNCLAGNSF